MTGMKKSTIKKVIRKKLNSWYNSITDEGLRLRVKQDSIVTGGAITSMLLGEKPNDYDIYFENKEIAKEVAEYYSNIFNELNPRLISAPKVKEEKIMNIRGEEEDRIVIWMQSEGVATEDKNDLTISDVISRTLSVLEDNAETNAYKSGWAAGRDSVEDAVLQGAEQLVEKSLDEKDKYRPIYITNNAISLRGKIQLVIRFHGEPDKIHDNYDFAHCMCYYRSSTNEVVLPPEALEAILTKTLIYKGGLYPVASILRTRKFINRGWRITAGQMLKIMFQISNIDLNDIPILREQLIGVDHSYMADLIYKINETHTKGDKIDESYLGGLIDEIFEDD